MTTTLIMDKALASIHEEASDTLKSILVCAVLLVLFCLGLTGGCSGAELPYYRDLPGWRRPDQCYRFARAFRDVLNDAGIPAARVTYDWRRPDGDLGRHCVVLFKHEGKLFEMDSEHLKPWEVKGATDLELLRPRGAYRMVNIVTLYPQEPKTIEQLFPAPLIEK